MDEVIEMFEEDHPNASVEIVQIPPEEYTTTLAPQMAAGTGPDVYPFFSQNLTTTIEDGWLEPLDERLAQSDLQDRLPPWVLELSTQDGHTYALARAATPQVLLVNMALLEEAGISEPPTTPDAFYEAAKAVKEQTDADWGFLTWIDPSDDQFLYRAVSQFTIGYGSEFAEPGTITIDVPEVREAVTLLKRMVDEDLAPFGMTYQDAREVFLQREAPFMIDGTWFAGDIRTDDPDLYEDLWVAKVPFPTGNALVGGGWTGINADSDNKDLAWAFLETYFSSEAQVRWAETTLRPGGTTDAPSDAWIEENAQWWPNLQDTINNHVTQLGYAPTGWQPVEAEFRQELAPFLIDIFSGRTSVEEGLAAAQAHMEEWGRAQGLVN